MKQLLLSALLLIPFFALAQAPPAWQAALTAAGTGTSAVRGTALNAAGDVFVTGSFSGQATFGSTILTSAGNDDMFVAKWNTAAGTWAWVVQSGGRSFDQGYGIAVSGTSVYVAGDFVNNTSNLMGVSFSGTVLTTNASATNADMFVAKYTDAGSSAALSWITTGGGTDNDHAYGVAVSGPSVYVTGKFFNTAANGNSVSFGGQALPGMSAAVSYDAYVAKYTDQGSRAVLGWVAAGGGTGYEESRAIAASGNSVYLTGFLSNTNTNANQVSFGGIALSGLGSSSNTPDMFLVKYLDAGSSATVVWATVGGGDNADFGYGLAVSGNSVYVAGSFVNSTANYNHVSFGGMTLNGAGNAGSNDVFVAKYNDVGGSVTCQWATAAGGNAADEGLALAVSGNAVYVAGYYTNDLTNANSVRFGPTALAGLGGSLANTDLFVAKYTDTGSSAAFNWVAPGGGNGADAGSALAARGGRVAVAGSVGLPAAFGSVVLPGSVASQGCAAYLADPLMPTPTRATLASEVALWPCPAHGQPVQVGLPAGTGLVGAEVLDALGRVVLRQAGTAPVLRLPTATLAAGVYTVRLLLPDGQYLSQRLAVE